MALPIDEIRVQLPTSGETKVVGYATVVLAGVAIHDIRLVVTREGRRIVSMPSRMVTHRCGNCDGKNVLSAAWCNWCGGAMHGPPQDGRPPAVDVAHPVRHDVRAALEAALWSEFARASEAGRARA